MTDYLIGIDLGQTNDYTAICVVQRDDTPPITEGALNRFMTEGHAPRERTEAVYQVRHLERLPLGTPYPEQVERVSQIAATVNALDALRKRDRRARLVVDQTGVGRPVVDMLRKAGHKALIGVSIHGGDQSLQDGREWRVPKRELVSVLQVLLQTKRLQVAAALPEANTLTREMLAFKVEISKSGHDTYGNDWRENPHDDMVLAVALAAWAGERIPTPGMRTYQFGRAPYGSGKGQA